MSQIVKPDNSSLNSIVSISFVKISYTPYCGVAISTKIEFKISYCHLQPRDISTSYTGY